MSDDIEEKGGAASTGGAVNKSSAATPALAGAPNARPEAAPESADKQPKGLSAARAQRKEERQQAKVARQQAKLAEAERKEALAQARSERRAARRNRLGAGAIGLLIGLVVGVAGLIVVGSLTDTFGLKQRQPEPAAESQAPTVSTSMLTTVIEDSAQLVTAKMSYDGAVRVETGAIPIINKSKFWIVYQGSVGAGIDVQAADVELEGNVVTVTIPHATVTDPVQIDPTSVQFFADESPVFSDDMGDMNEAMRLAAEDMQAKIDVSDLISRADDHAVAVIHQLLDSRVGDLKVEVKFQEENEAAPTEEGAGEEETGSDSGSDGSATAADKAAPGESAETEGAEAEDPGQDESQAAGGETEAAAS